MTLASPVAFLLGPPEMAIVLALVALLFLGPKKLPELARSLGESTQEFKKGREELEDEIQEQTNNSNEAQTETTNEA